MIITDKNIKGKRVGRLHNRGIIGDDGSSATQRQCQPIITPSAYFPCREQNHKNNDFFLPKNALERGAFSDESDPQKCISSNEIPMTLYDRSRLHPESTSIGSEDKEKEDKKHGLRKQERIDTWNPLLRCQKELPVRAIHSKKDNITKGRLQCIHQKPVFPRKRHRKEVTFAGFPTLVEKAGRIDKTLCLGFLDAIIILRVPPLSDYSTEDIENIWYSREEEQSMKYSAIEERILQADSISNRDDASAIPAKMTAGERYISHLQLRAGQKRAALDAVLHEQYHQRLICRRIYGKIVPTTAGNRYSSGIIDPERIREVYRSRGKTMKSQKAAHARAQICRLEQQRDDTKCNEDDLDEYVNDITPMIYRDSCDVEDLTVKDEYYAKPTFCSQCSSNTSMAFYDCIDCVFNVLLTRFLELRKGAIFLDNEDEMLVTMVPRMH
eukprot:jgi/Psemu1/327289/estExt_fgenesh1_pg.C_6060003